MRSDFYSDIELPINRADALALAQLLLGDANALNEIPAQIDAVTVGRPPARGLEVPDRGQPDGRGPPAGARRRGEGRVGA